MPLYIIPQRYALRGATAAELAARNEVLLDREFCQETDTKRFKLGDGSTRWNDLPYAGVGGADLTGLADGNVMVYDETLGIFVPGTAGLPDASAASILLGRGAGAGAGPMQEITLGTGLSMSGTTINAATGAGSLSHVGTATVAGAAATSLTLSGLDLSADDRYMIDWAFDNATASTADITLTFNGDTTATNYYNQTSTMAGGTINSGIARANNAKLCFLEASETATGQANIMNDRDGKARTIANICRAAPATINLQTTAHVWNSATNVTSITMTSSVASAFAIGTYFRVFKVAT